MAKVRVRPVEEEATIDMTPMLDIVFIMLIFFIVTASFVKEAGIEVDKPFLTEAVSKPTANIFIAVNANSEIYMQKKIIKPEAVRTTVEKARLENPEGAVVVQADKRAKSGVILQVFDAVKAAGVKDVSFAPSTGG